MNDFTRNLNDHFKQHRTLYAEEKNIANKEKIEDRRGLWNAYSSPSAFYKTSKTLYISGTGGCDGSLTRDIMDDLLLVPTRTVHHSEKYKHVIEELEKSPEITRLVGHNLASAVIRSIKNNLIHLLQQPMLPLHKKNKKERNKSPKRLDYLNPSDIVSMLDGYAVTSDLKEPNPLMSHSYINFEGNGLWNINPGTNISNGFNPQSLI